VAAGDVVTKLSPDQGRSGELDDINMLMAGLAKKGKHVVRLTGGDSSGPLRRLAAEETTAPKSAAVPASSAAP
jgi:siroheme synthase